MPKGYFRSSFVFFFFFFSYYQHFPFSECVYIFHDLHSEASVSVTSGYGVVIPLTPSVSQCCDGFMSILLCAEV